MAAAKVLDGKWLSSIVQASVRRKVDEYRTAFGRVPGLGVILVGDNPASRSYVASKEKIAAACGLRTFDAFLPESAPADEVAKAIRAFNTNGEVDGILLQLPLPKHIRSESMIDLIDPKKDADGLHPLNQGLLLRGEGTLRPCTPLGVMALIDLAFAPYNSSGTDLNFEAIPPVDLSGKTAIVIGRSVLVGRPLGQLLLERNATVVMAHSRSAHLDELCRSADVVVAAVGRPGLVQGSWIKKGAVVIDVGINRLATGKLVGDIEYAAAAEHAAAITPVPGGVGPMTVVMLVQNTVRAFLESNSRLS